MELLEFEDIETFDEWVENHDVSDELWEFAESAEDSDQVHFDAFYCYLTDEDIH